VAGGAPDLKVLADQKAPMPELKAPMPETKTPAEVKPMPESKSPAASMGATGPVLSPPGVLSTMPTDGTIVTAPSAPEFWVSAEYMAWRIRKDRVPPLVATGPAAFPVGILGNPGTVVLSDRELDPGTFTGVRLRAGCWLDTCQSIGVEGSIFGLHERTNTASFNSGQFPVLTRPFTDVNPGGANSEFLAFPGISSGAITIENKTRLLGASLYARCPICNIGCGRVDALLGPQYLDLREELTITERSTFAPNAPFPGLAGNSFTAVDQFKTSNRFCGFLFGGSARASYECLTFDLMAGVGVGVTRQEIEINGSQQSSLGSASGGLLALPGGNIGKHEKDQFSLVPQLGLNVGYQVTSYCQIFVGYTCLYWTGVVRPGQQIDPVLDVNRIPNFGGGAAATAVRPQVPFERSTFWAQGVSVGVQFSW
jgi:hypothetical protein